MVVQVDPVQGFPNLPTNASVPPPEVKDAVFGKSLAGAPEGVKALVEKCGGLRAAQLLFWGGPDDAAGVFGLWWPWGDGTTVSLRIGLHDVDLPKERYPKLRDIFGIPQTTGAAAT